MDLTFKTDEGVFNFRVCAVIIHNSKLLAMKTNNTPYFFLPGGRVKLHESMQDAIAREIKEELGNGAEIVRPLWLNQGFFREDVTGKQFHELCLYYLVDIRNTGLLDKGDSFTLFEGNRSNYFEWIPLDRLKDEYLYPLFMKREIHDLPNTLKILTEYE